MTSPGSRLGPPERATLDNGLRVVVAPLAHLQTATVSLLVKVGSRNETRADNGLSHLLEHMLFRGTHSRPSAFELNLHIEELGGTLYGATHVDFTLLSVTVPAQNVGPAMAALGEVVRAPAFTRLETEKRIIREELLEGLDEHGEDIDADNVSRALLFSPHPLGFKIIGSAENLRRFDIEDLRRHMARHYVARNAVVSVSGAVQCAAVLEAASEAFSTLRAGTAAQVTPPALDDDARRFAYVRHHGSQTEVRLCYPTFGERDARCAALRLLSRILDDGMSSRLHRRLCDDTGLAYDAFAGTDLYEDCGVYDLGATVEHGKAPEVLGELLALARRLREKVVDARELDKARRRHRWDLRASVDDDEAISWFHGAHALFGHEETLESAEARAAAVGTEDVRELAGELFQPGRLRVVCVGSLDGPLLEATREVFERET